jgi:hypothetical protein
VEAVGGAVKVRTSYGSCLPEFRSAIDDHIVQMADQALSLEVSSAGPVWPSSCQDRLTS